MQASAVIIHAEVSGVRVRNIDGNEGDAGSSDFVGNDRCGVLVYLELDDNIDALADKGICVSNRGLSVVAVVEHQQIERIVETLGTVIRETA